MQFHIKNKKGHGFWILWITSIFLASLHFSTLNLSPTLNYDHVRNMQIIMQVSQGNFDSILHHISPLFFLFFGFLYWCGLGFEELRMLNVAFPIACVGLVAAWWARQGLSLWHACGAMLLIGLSVVFSYNIRALSIEAGSLVFVGILVCALGMGKPVRACLAAGLGFLYNYKILLVFMPFMIVWLCFHYKELKLKTYIQALAAFGLPILVMEILAIILGLPILLYPKKIWAVALIKNVNPQNNSTAFQLDSLYYFKYLWNFETYICVAIFLMVAGIILSWLFQRRYVASKQTLFWLLGAVLFICLIMPLQKAPRALLPWLMVLIFPLMELAGRTLRHIKLLIILGLIPIFVMQLRNSWQHAIGVNKDFYPKLANFMYVQKIDTLYSMASLGFWPIAHQSHIHLHSCLTNHCFPVASPKIWYLLDDGYRQATGLHIPLPPQAKLIFQTENPVYGLPMLFFEHSEFASESYTQTQSRYDSAHKQQTQIKLYKVIQ